MDILASKTLDFLLEPYRIHLEDCCDGQFKLVFDDNVEVLALDRRNLRCLKSFSWIGDIIDNIQHSICKFTTFDFDNLHHQSADNIYLGSKNLDEMLVRRDLYDINDDNIAWRIDRIY